jgi:hypothetical protein
MLSGNEYTWTSGTTTESLLPPGGFTLLNERPAAVDHADTLVLDDWLPQRRDHLRRLQNTVDAVESQVALLNDCGEIAVVNRAWRMTAVMQGLNDPRHGLGVNYLTLCRHAAARGCRDAANTAEGIDAVLEGRWRSFYYKYLAKCANEHRAYAMTAWRIVEDGQAYVAVMHELLETRPL